MSRAHKKAPSADIEATAADWVIRRERGLGPAEARQFAAWRAADAAHAEAIVRHDQAWSFLDQPHAAGRAEEVISLIASRAQRRRTRRAWAATLISGCCLVLAAGWWAYPGMMEPAPTTAVVVLPRKETLPDGTIVELQHGARITVDYHGAARRVTLAAGEALFDVAKDPNRAFVVTAAGIEVRAVGTAFVVGINRARVDVIVTEGRVSVEKLPPSSDRSGKPEPAPADAGGFTTLIDAGRGITLPLTELRATPEPLQLTETDLVERLAWRAPRLEFTETPLVEAVQLMNRHAKIRLVIDDPGLAGLRVNGLFRADNTETLVRLLEASFGVRAMRSGNTITLRWAR